MSRIPRQLQTPISVLLVIDDLGRGGAQRQLTELVKAMPRDRFVLHVVSLSTTKCDYVEMIQRTGTPLTLIAQSGTWSWPTFFSLLRLVRRIRPQLVHTWLFTAGLYGRVAAWMARVPVIVSAVRSVEPDKPAHYVTIDRLLRRITQGFTVNARVIGDVVAARERVSRAKIHTISNGIDLSVFDPTRVATGLRQHLQLPVHTPVVGIVGRLSPVKDHDTFLRAAALIAQQHPQVRFLIVGSGPLREPLEQLARALGVASRAVFLDHHPDIPAVFAACSIAVVTSAYEGCCNAILEAMAMGKPVIATAVGGNPELVIDGQTGLLIPTKDPAALAQAVLGLLDDPDRCARMGQAGRRLVEEQFTLERLVAEMGQLYTRLLPGPNHQGRAAQPVHSPQSTVDSPAVDCAHVR